MLWWRVPDFNQSTTDPSFFAPFVPFCGYSGLEALGLRPLVVGLPGIVVALEQDVRFARIAYPLNPFFEATPLDTRPAPTS